MASKETLGRIRHLGLASQQRRLRHLHSVSARNIIPKFPLFGESLVDCLLETYFSLHDYQDKEDAIYTSEKIVYSLNPTWASFELNTGNDCLKYSSTLFMVRLWGGHGSNFSLIIEWKADLTALEYLGDQVRTSNHPPNTLIFGLVDGYYGAPMLSLPHGLVEPHLNVSVEVDIDHVVPSYNTYSLQRLRALQCAIRESQISVQQYQHSIEERLQTKEKSMLQLSKRESVKLKLKLLREEFESKTAVVKKEREEEKKMLQTIRKRERNLAKKRKEFEEKNLLLREHRQAYVDKRESLVKLNAQLNMRKRQLACELTSIYPIIQVDSTDFLICNVRLPNSESEDFFATDDEILSCALGYSCHLVYMISKILEVPLRYAMNPMGSRSTIMDYTIEKVPIKDREFPLHTKGKEKIQFYYGIFLLNKNIAQLRQYCSLATPNLRNTLPNIKDTLESKFRAYLETKKANINEPTPINTFTATSQESTLQAKMNHDTTPPQLSESPQKPPLMPKPASLKSKTVADVNKCSSTQSSEGSSSKPPLPPKPANLRHSKTKETLLEHENGLLTVVNYDFSAEQEEQLASLQNIEAAATNNESKATVQHESAIKPTPQGATHKFFEKRTKKGSRSLSNAEDSLQCRDKKHDSTWSKKRKSLNDLRNVPVEVIRERQAYYAKIGVKPISEADGLLPSVASNTQESTPTDSPKSSHPPTNSNGIETRTLNERSASNLL